MVTVSLQLLMIAVFCAGQIIAGSASHASRWYITPAFTTFFCERVLQTLLGVSIAYLFGIVVCYLASRGRTIAKP
jgi:hypothetical protein